MDVKKQEVVPKLFIGMITAFCLIAFLSCGYQKGKVAEDKSVFYGIEAIQDSFVSKDSLLTFDSTFAEQVQVPTQKMNKNNLVIKEWITNVTTNVRVLDHVTTYNANGKKIEEIEYNGEGQKWREPHP